LTSLQCFTNVLINDSNVSCTLVGRAEKKGLKMNKAKLVEHMSKLTKMPKASCKKALEAFIKSVGQSLKSGKSVVLTGFGSFSIMKRKARTGVNPATHKKMQIPAKRVAKFKPGKALRTLVAG
jgi:DNA-binding protein HU-beta